MAYDLFPQNPWGTMADPQTLERERLAKLGWTRRGGDEDGGWFKNGQRRLGSPYGEEGRPQGGGVTLDGAQWQRIGAAPEQFQGNLGYEEFAGQMRYDPTYGWIAPEGARDTLTGLNAARNRGSSIFDDKLVMALTDGKHGGQNEILRNAPIVAGAALTAGGLAGLAGYGPMAAGAAGTVEGAGAVGAAGALEGAGAAGAGAGGTGVGGSMMGMGELGSGFSSAGLASGVGGTSLPAIGTATGTALPGAATALGAGVAPTAAAAGVSAVGGGLAGLMTPANMQTLIKAGGGLYQIFQAAQASGDIKKAQQVLQQAFERSDPFATARQGAANQYMQWQQDPMSYMSSPLAKMQIDEMNRAARAKQASLGQTWNIGADGGIQGSGIGAVDFAGQLQTNLSKQYETALNNRATQGGMNLFPNMQALSQMGDMLGLQNQTRTATGAGAGQVLGALPDLVNFGKSIFGA